MQKTLRFPMSNQRISADLGFPMFFHCFFGNVHFLARKVMIFDMLQVERKMLRSGKPINPNGFSSIPEIVRKLTSGAIFGILTISLEKHTFWQSRLPAILQN